MGDSESKEKSKLKALCFEHILLLFPKDIQTQLVAARYSPLLERLKVLEDYSKDW